MQTSDYIVHIVDDEEPVRKSLAFLLTMAGFAVRVHESATGFLAIAPTLRRGCLITDLRMPDMSGIELLSRLEAAKALMPAILITGHGDVPMAVAAMKAGAIDFIEKPIQEDVLIEAIHRAAKLIPNPAALPESPASISARLEQLSEREKQVLKAVVAGQPNKRIAHELDISPRTVEVHRANVMTKMQAKSLPDLVRMTLLTERA